MRQQSFLGTGGHPLCPPCQSTKFEGADDRGNFCIFGHNGENCSQIGARIRLKTLTEKEAKYGFGRLIDLTRTELVAVAKHGRPVVGEMAVEKYERLKVLEIGHVDSHEPVRKSVCGA